MIMGVDIETYSSVDLQKAGVRPYTEAPDFTILLISYRVDDQQIGRASCRERVCQYV